MSVYAKERPEFLRESLRSLIASTIQPTEVVLVEDGPIDEQLQLVVDEARGLLNIVTVKLPLNRGLPAALNIGLNACSFDLVARFDTDDICEPNRFALQLKFMDSHPEVAALGTAIKEFDSISGKIMGLRAPPTDHTDIVKFAKLSSPLNHPSVIFKRKVVQSVGGYPEHLNIAFEDYYLWINLILAGYVLSNLPQTLVQMRAGYGQASRRSGVRYAEQELLFAKHFRKAGFFSFVQYLRFIFLRVPIRLFPKRLVQVAYMLLARTQS